MNLPLVRRWPSRPPVRRVRRVMDLASGLILVLAWVLFRAPFYECGAVPLFWADSFKYLDSSFDLWQGRLPHFYAHSPLYSLVLAVTMASGYRATLLFQGLLSLAAAGVFALGARRWSPWLVLPAALAMGLWLLHPGLLMLETSLLSEAIYGPLLLLGYGCLIWSVATRRTVWCALTGLAFGLAIAAHDAGLFLLVVALLSSGYAWRRGWGWRPAAALLAPVVGVVLCVQAYNLATTGEVFTRGAYNLALSTVPWWRVSASNPEDVNEYVRAAQENVPPAARSEMERSWDAHELRAIVIRYYRRRSIESRPLLRLARRLSADKGGGAVSYADLSPIFRRLALDAIRSRPELYAKFVGAQLSWFFLPARVRHRRGPGEPGPTPREAYAATVLRPARLARYLAVMRRFNDATREVLPPPPVTASERHFYAADLESLLAAHRGGLGSSGGPRPYEWLRVRLLTAATHPALWTGLWLLSLLLSAWVVLVSRGKNSGAVFLLLLALGRLGAGLLVSLVGLVRMRYAVPTEPLAIAAVLLLPMLWIEPDAKG